MKYDDLTQIKIETQEIEDLKDKMIFLGKQYDKLKSEYKESSFLSKIVIVILVGIGVAFGASSYLITSFLEIAKDLTPIVLSLLMIGTISFVIPNEKLKRNIKKLEQEYSIYLSEVKKKEKIISDLKNKENEKNNDDEITNKMNALKELKKELEIKYGKNLMNDIESDKVKTLKKF